MNSEKESKLTELTEEKGKEETQTAETKMSQIESVEEEESKEDDEIFIAFARIFSGSLKRGQKLYVLGPKYDPAKGLNFDKGTDDEEQLDIDSITR